MAGRNKHSARSQRKSHVGIPYGMFYQRAAKVAEHKEKKNLLDQLREALSKKGEE